MTSRQLKPTFSARSYASWMLQRGIDVGLDGCKAQPPGLKHNPIRPAHLGNDVGSAASRDSDDFRKQAEYVCQMAGRVFERKTRHSGCAWPKTGQS
jgi:hypothetical protein